MFVTRCHAVSGTRNAGAVSRYGARQTGATSIHSSLQLAVLAPSWRQLNGIKGVKLISRMGGVRQAPPGGVSALRFLTPFEALSGGDVK